MERGLILLLATLTFIISSTTVQADKCGNRCTSTQICGDNGICYEESELITCLSYTDLFSRHYCLKSQECCDDGCAPKGSVCCNFAGRYCDKGQECCSFILCCLAGTICSGSRCIDDIFSTKKPSTVTPVTKPITRYPDRTTRWYEHETKKPSTRGVLESWVYAVIVVSVIAVVCIFVAAFFIRRHRNTSNAHPDRMGVVLSAPTHTYTQATAHNGSTCGAQT